MTFSEFSAALAACGAGLAESGTNGCMKKASADKEQSLCAWKLFKKQGKAAYALLRLPVELFLTSAASVLSLSLSLSCLVYQADSFIHQNLEINGCNTHRLSTKLLVTAALQEVLHSPPPPPEVPLPPEAMALAQQAGVDVRELQEKGVQMAIDFVQQNLGPTFEKIPSVNLGMMLRFDEAGRYQLNASSSIIGFPTLPDAQLAPG